MIIHTVRKGHYMRTLRPSYTPGYGLSIPMLAVDEMGHIVVYCRETLPIDEQVFTNMYFWIKYSLVNHLSLTVYLFCDFTIP